MFTPQLVLDTYGSPFTKDPVTGGDSWAIRQALLTHINGINVPIQLGQQYQDEQTGPRGGHVLWENISAGLPKRIALSTGVHNPNDPTGNKRDWLDCWVLNSGNPDATTGLGHSCADVMDPAKRVLLDFDPTTGATTFVQRGLLRASFNATFDASRSQRTPSGDVYRPYYEYTSLTPVVPGQINKYEVEIFPLGHVWRAGHQLVLQLHAPPANDPISTYAFEPNEPGVVSILQDADHRTTILLPFMPTLPPMRPTPPVCGEVVGEVCVTPALG